MNFTLISILSAIVSIATSVTVAVVQTVLIRKVNDSITLKKEEAQKIKETNEAIQNGLMALLGDAIDRLCRKAIKDDDLEELVSDLEKINHLNKPYKALNGNGVIKAEIESVIELYHEKVKALSYE